VTRVRDNRPEWIYVAVAGTLYAVNGDGYVRWSVNPGGDRLGEPVVIRHGGEELVVVTSGGTNPQLNADRADGRLAWRVALDAPALGSPTVANGHICVCDDLEPLCDPKQDEPAAAFAETGAAVR
jgi:outer membrane protein assembly factor BamB